MRTQLDKLGKVKQSLHATQAVFIFIAWALTVAVLTRPGGTGSQTWFFFALCFITGPALIYQVMVPLYPRAQRFANVYAYASLDILFAILWFSAAIAVAVWNSAGISKGREDNKDSDGSCNYFGFGDATKCSTSKAAVGFGVLIFFLFAGSAAISVLFCKQFWQTGVTPGLMERNTFSRPDDATKDVWSATIEERDHDDYEEPDERRKYGRIIDEDGQGLLHEPTSYILGDYSGPHPGAQLRYEASATSLHSGQQYDSYVPSALSPGGHDHDTTTAYQPGLPSQRTEQRYYANLDYSTGGYDRS